MDHAIKSPVISGIIFNKSERPDQIKFHYLFIMSCPNNL